MSLRFYLTGSANNYIHMTLEVEREICDGLIAYMCGAVCYSRHVNDQRARGSNGGPRPQWACGPPSGRCGHKSLRKRRLHLIDKLPKHSILIGKRGHLLLG
jgi:hypothetical protein